MKNLLLMIIASAVVHAHSLDDQTHPVRLSCPGVSETERGPAGVPGKRGSKGETGSIGILVIYTVVKTEALKVQTCSCFASELSKAILASKFSSDFEMHLQRNI